ncbi:hypothetical protein P3S68_003108 [Capsicum galapagoense]
MLIGPPKFLNKKPRDNFTPIGESHASLFQKLRELDMISPLLGVTSLFASTWYYTICGKQ